MSKVSERDALVLQRPPSFAHHSVIASRDTFSVLPVLKIWFSKSHQHHLTSTRLFDVDKRTSRTCTCTGTHHCRSSPRSGSLEKESVDYENATCWTITPLKTMMAWCGTSDKGCFAKDVPRFTNTQESKSSPKQAELLEFLLSRKGYNRY